MRRAVSRAMISANFTVALPELSTSTKPASVTFGMLRGASDERVSSAGREGTNHGPFLEKRV